MERRSFLASLLGVLGISKTPLQAIPLGSVDPGVALPGSAAQANSGIVWPEGNSAVIQGDLIWDRSVGCEGRAYVDKHGDKYGLMEAMGPPLSQDASNIALGYPGTWGWEHKGEPVWFPTLPPLTEKERHERQNAIHMKMLEDVDPAEDIMVRAREIGGPGPRQTHYWRRSDGAITDKVMLNDPTKYLEE